MSITGSVMMTGNNSAYNFPRNALTTARMAFSFRRYHRHCPCLVASTNPAFVKIRI